MPVPSTPGLRLGSNYVIVSEIFSYFPVQDWYNVYHEPNQVHDKLLEIALTCRHWFSIARPRLVASVVLLIGHRDPERADRHLSRVIKAIEDNEHLVRQIVWLSAVGVDWDDEIVLGQYESYQRLADLSVNNGITHAVRFATDNNTMPIMAKLSELAPSLAGCFCKSSWTFGGRSLDWKLFRRFRQLRGTDLVRCFTHMDDITIIGGHGQEQFLRFAFSPEGRPAHNITSLCLSLAEFISARALCNSIATFERLVRLQSEYIELVEGVALGTRDDDKAIQTYNTPPSALAYLDNREEKLAGFVVSRWLALQTEPLPLVSISVTHQRVFLVEDLVVHSWDTLTTLELTIINEPMNLSRCTHLSRLHLIARSHKDSAVNLIASTINSVSSTTLCSVELTLPRPPTEQWKVLRDALDVPAFHRLRELSFVVVVPEDDEWVREEVRAEMDVLVDLHGFRWTVNDLGRMR